MKRLVKLITCLLIVTVLCFSATGCQFIGRVDEVYQTNSANSMQHVQFSTSNSQDRTELSLVDAVALVERSSVMIQTDNALGSGVISDISITNNSYLNNSNFVFILTCHHVISTARSIKVTLPDENFRYDNENFAFSGVIGSDIAPSDYAISLVGGDKLSDIAVLKLDLSKTKRL